MHQADTQSENARLIEASLQQAVVSLKVPSCLDLCLLVITQPMPSSNSTEKLIHAI